MTDYATNPATTTAADASTIHSGTTPSWVMQLGINFSSNPADTIVPGVPPRPQVGLVWPRIQ